MTDGSGTGVDGSYALLAEFLDQHSQREQTHIRGTLFRAEAVFRQQRAEPREVTPLPRRKSGAASVKVAVRRQVPKSS
ncbi:hypothetical protein SHIRM173S_11478 [Streptomyces hirsutus]